MPEAPPAEPSFQEAVAKGLESHFATLNAPPAAPPATAPPPPAPPSTPRVPAPAPTTPPAEPKRPTIPPLKPPAPPAPPAAPAADPADEPPESIKSTKAADDWRKLHAEARTLRQQIQTKDGELSKLMERVNKPPAEVEKLKAQIQDLSERLRINDIERHPQFQQYFGNRAAAAIAQARTAVGVEQAENITRLLQMPDSEFRTQQIDALIAEIPSAARQSRVLSALTELDRLNAERNEAIERAKKDGTTAEQQRQQEQQAHVAKANEIFNATIKEATENLPTFQLREGDHEWNAGVQERIEVAKSIFAGQMPFEEMARATIWAASAPALNQMVLQLQQELAAVKAENASMQAASPSPSGGGEAPPATDDPNETFQDRVRKAAEQGGHEFFRR